MTETTALSTPTPARPRRLPAALTVLLRGFITLALPVFLVLSSVGVVMTETFLRFEYHRPGFPKDPYGFTLEDRLKYGPYGVRYLLNDKDIHYLENVSLGNDQPLFREKELEHMEDVKTVTKAAFQVHTFVSAALLITVLILSWRPETRHGLRLALSGGGVFTIGIMMSLVIGAVIGWDLFFDSFHAVFFEGNSWRFYTSDNLIRLYPEQFWFDAALTIGTLTLFGALAALGIAWYWERTASRQNESGAAVDPAVVPASENPAL